jgi:hypothetical protein
MLNKPVVTRGHQTERAMALAFLKSGHPWLVFGVVVIKTFAQVATLALLFAGMLITNGKWPIQNWLPTLLN